MADRAVHKTRKNPDGDITALCSNGATWSPREKWDAIWDIDSTNGPNYYVPWQSGSTWIRVVEDPTVAGGKYLRTDRDSTSKNNLDDLPDC